MQMPSSAFLPAIQASIFPGFQFQSALGIWVPNLLLTAALVVMLLNGVLRGIPSEAEDAAILDGCGFWRTLDQLVIPRLGRLILVMAFVLLLAGWEDVMAPRVILYRSQTTVLPVPGNSAGSIPLVDTRAILLGGNIHDAGARAAILMILLIPVISFVYLAQRFLFKGRFTDPQS